MCGLQNFRSGHPSFLLCQLVQPVKRIFHIRPSDQLLQIFFRSALLDLLRRNPKNGKHLHHDFHSYTHHFWCQRHLCISLETSKETLDALKNIHEGVVARANIPNRQQEDTHTRKDHPRR
ncbi:hypothetical protein BC826DRAFT_1022140 [Russula brevipes]|nr:hypothetical protein BC826DRAFT_1022140 [Russula brevipes]